MLLFGGRDRKAFVGSSCRRAAYFPLRLFLAQVVIGCLGIAWGIISIVVGVLGLGLYNEMSGTELVIRILNIDTAFGVVWLLLSCFSIAAGATGIRSARLALPSADDAVAKRSAAELFHAIYLAVSIGKSATVLAGCVKTTLWVASLSLGANNMFQVFALGGKLLAFVVHVSLRGYFWFVIWSFMKTVDITQDFHPFSEEPVHRAAIVDGRA